MAGKKNLLTENHCYHDTELFLDNYRDIKFSLKCALLHLNRETDSKFTGGMEIYFQQLHQKGVELGNPRLRDQAESLHMTSEMLRVLEESLEFIKENHKHGTEIYALIFHTWLSPQVNTVSKVIDQLQAEFPEISSSTTYYRKRKEAIDALSCVLWGYMSRDILYHMEKVLSSGKWDDHIM